MTETFILLKLSPLVCNIQIPLNLAGSAGSGSVPTTGQMWPR